MNKFRILHTSVNTYRYVDTHPLAAYLLLLAHVYLEFDRNTAPKSSDLDQPETYSYQFRDIYSPIVYHYAMHFNKIKCSRPYTTVGDEYILQLFIIMPCTSMKLNAVGLIRPLVTDIILQLFIIMPCTSIKLNAVGLL